MATSAIAKQALVCENLFTSRRYRRGSSLDFKELASRAAKKFYSTPKVAVSAAQALGPAVAASQAYGARVHTTFCSRIAAATDDCKIDNRLSRPFENRDSRCLIPTTETLRALPPAMIDQFAETIGPQGYTTIFAATQLRRIFRFFAS